MLHIFGSVYQQQLLICKWISWLKDSLTPDFNKNAQWQWIMHKTFQSERPKNRLALKKASWSFN